jgi:drug/metabolite transporter (DMT)-like permease
MLIGTSRLLWLLASGLIGISVADTLFFVALRKLGAELTAIVDCVYAPFIIGLSFLILRERMTVSQTGGVGLAFAGATLVSIPL